MAEPQWHLLAHGDQRPRLHLRRAQQIERVGLAPLAQSGFELECNVEMLHQRRLAASGDHAELFNSGGARFLDRILDQRLVHDRQHFLGGCLGSGQKSRAEAGDRQHRFTQWFNHDLGSP
jgi:hypothetical protein